MNRITKADIKQAVKVANGKLERMEHPNELYISYAMGQPRPTWFVRESGNMEGDAGPIGTKREVHTWLCAFIEGLGAAEHAARIAKESAPQAAHIAELAAKVDAITAEFPEGLSQYERATNPEVSSLEDLLTGKAWLAARLLDKLRGTDPNHCKGTPPTLGTPNRRSITYKVRKALGYSYP